MDKSVYARPNKPRFLQVKKRSSDFSVEPLPSPNLVTVHKSTECHVTPEEAAGLMIDCLNLEDGLSAIDPEMGTGNLVNALLQSGFALDVTGNELNGELFRVCEKRFSQQNVTLISDCWLAHAAENTGKKYDRIITNPPFRNTKKHIEASLTMLAPGGVMVALVPILFKHPGATELLTLDRGIFALTNVYTKLIAFYR
jgi:hypothetical protein